MEIGSINAAPNINISNSNSNGNIPNIEAKAKENTDN